MHAIRLHHKTECRTAGKDTRIIHRIGADLGDIILEGEDVLGDGVNIAASIETLAEPGGVAVLGRVHDDTPNGLDADFTDFGGQGLKNIARPIPVWRWSLSVSGAEE